MAGTAKAAEIDSEMAPPAPPPPKSRGGLGMVIGAVVASVAASGGVAYWFSTRTAAHGAEAAAEGGEHAAVESHKAAAYLPLDPAFVVNLTDDEAMRFLQVSVEVMARDEKVIDDVKLHTPRIRNALLLLLGTQHAAEIATREGKEKLQAAVLAEVQKVLTEETGKPGVDAVYFTSFVMQ